MTPAMTVKKTVEAFDHDAYAEAAVPTLDSVPEVLRQAAKDANPQIGAPVLDDAESLIFARQLEHLKSRTAEILYAELKGRQFVPISTEVDPEAEFITYRVYDGYTMAKVITNYATDWPTVSESGAEHYAKLFDVGVAYEYSIKDLRKAAKANVPLDAKLARRAKQAIELAIDDAIAIGVPQVKTFGLTNNPNVPILTMPTGTWSGATGEQMLADLNSLVTQMLETSLEIFSPNTFILPTAAFRRITTKMVNSAAGSMTVLRAFQEQNPGVTVSSWTKLNSANATADGGRIVCYFKSPEVLEFEMGREFEALPAERHNLMIKTPCWATMAGVQVHHPYAIAYCDNHGD